VLVKRAQGRGVASFGADHRRAGGTEVVFVGGSVAGLLLTDPIADGIRATKDVDAVVEATTLSQYHQMEKHLSVSGFKRDTGSEVVCRWTHGHRCVV
jgi:hypothetical protein